jgi:hypothetical protein
MTKKEIIEELYLRCKRRNDFTFDNNFVKDILRSAASANNPYDMTKIDDLSKLPETVVNEGYTIIHLGDGKHKFIKCLDKIYHTFETITDDEVMDWPYRPSILNDFSISESSILSLVNNHRILHDFLFQDFSAAPKMYNSERKNNITFDYYIDNERITVKNLQIEIDLTIEHGGYVTVFEGKNSPPNSWLTNFNVYQLYNPFRYYYNLHQENKLTIKKLTACYLVKQKENENSKIRLYNYTFADPFNLASIQLLRKREYRLKKRILDND